MSENSHAAQQQWVERVLGVRFAGGSVSRFFDSHVHRGFGDLMVALAGLLLAFWFVRFLYQKKIFLRL